MKVYKQRGITLAGFLGFGFLIAVFGLLLMRVAPVYIQHYTVIQSAKALRSLPAQQLLGAPAVVRMQLKDKLTSQLHINGIDHVKSKNIQVKPIKNAYRISIVYDVKVPLVSNIELLFHFNSIVKVFTRGS